jgi:urease accessory protein UreH
VSEPQGTLNIAARRVGARTIIERIRYDGISRCSRMFRSGDAALVMISQLGPGVVRGDEVTMHGRLEPGAHLIITQQTATRVLGGTRPARASATWSVGENARLELLSEPLLASPDADYAATTTIDLAPNACVLISELGTVPSGARVRLRVVIRRAEREIFYDAIDAAAAAPRTVGMLAYVGPTPEDSAALLVALDTAVDVCADFSIGTRDVRVGTGLLPNGVFARVSGLNVWSVRSALASLRAALTVGHRR